MFWKRRRGKRGMKGLLHRAARVLRWSFRILLLLLVVDLFYLAVTWPDWKKLAAGPVPKSAFMLDYEKQLAEHKDWPRVRWQPVPLSAIPKHMIRSVILAEDSRFYQHSGFDLIAFKEAMDYNLAQGRLVLGASTISQQTVKNLFLSPSRNPLRKWHELILTWAMEQNLSKRRILELYLNVAQFGRGIYGVQAAAQTYWGLASDQLSAAQAAELTASLPSPVKNNPASRTRYFDKRARKILALLERYPGDAVDTVYVRTPELFAPPPENGSDANEPAPDNASEPMSPAQDQRTLPPPESTGKPPVEDLSIPANRP
ncbi:MAG: monofunctional biosynthetic peptidoglycan transglycosylase [Gammaproteobacteria bacterium]|nr:monofunctional biosynthetic peptidoglycan transglycosylase [Gammaproteobacteria bacterium]